MFATAALFAAACSSSDTAPTLGSSSGSSGASSGSSGAPPVDSGLGAAADSAAPPDAGGKPGTVALAEGPCTIDADCAPTARGTVACFIGGMGGGMGDGGSAPTSYCSLKCSPPGSANTTTCSAPFLGLCNGRGYCKLH